MRIPAVLITAIAGALMTAAGLALAIAAHAPRADRWAMRPTAAGALFLQNLSQHGDAITATTVGVPSTALGITLVATGSGVLLVAIALGIGGIVRLRRETAGLV